MPLVVYIPDHPYTVYNNFSTFKLSYTDEERDAFFDNGFHQAAGNNTALTSSTPKLPTCLACALVSRAERRANMTQTAQCQACFSVYCWDGVSNSTQPNGEYAPEIPGVRAAMQAGGAGTSGSPTPNSNAALSMKVGSDGVGTTSVSLVGIMSCVAALAGSSLLLL